MSSDRDLYRQYGQLSTGGYSSYLDGVPVVIAEKYRPLPRVLLTSAAFEPRHVCDVLEDEYDFELEESVIEKYAIRVKEQAVEEQEKVDQIGNATQDVLQIQAPESSTDPNESDQPDGSARPPLHQGVTSDNDSSTIQRGNLNPTAEDEGSSMGLVPPFSSTILQPTPIIPARKATPKEETKAFRVTDFETVQDPFDDLELEVLDDMAELGKVLQVAQTQHTKSPVEQPNSAPIVNGNSQPGVVSSSITNKHGIEPPPENVSDESSALTDPQMNSGFQTVASTASNRETETSHIQDSQRNQTQHSSVYCVHPGPTCNLNNNACRFETVTKRDGANMKLLARDNRYSLPNISVPSAILQQGVKTNGNLLPSVGLPDRGLQTPNKNFENGPAYSGANTLDNFDRFTSLNRDSIPTIATQNNSYPYDDLLPQVANQNYVTMCFGTSSCSFTAKSSKQFKDSSVSDHHMRSTKPLSGLRSARSTPDISKLDDSSTSAYRLSHSPPPRPSYQDARYGYSPVLSSPNMMSTSLSDTSRTSTPTSSDSPTTLLDPFVRLSHKEQEFALAVADMGFPRAQVARAVQSLGADGKQVVDYLCQVNRLVDHGFPTEDAESSLQLFNNDLEKAENYLELQSQLQELGFSHSKVREALVLHDNNRDKALDYLTT